MLTRSLVTRLAAVAAAAVACFAVAGEVRTPEQAVATHKGTLRVDPLPAAVVIEGHTLTVPVTLQTCYPPLTDAQCRLGAYQAVVAWDTAKFTLRRDSGTSTGGNSLNVLRDTTKNWKVNEWKDSTLTLRSGNTLGQFRVTGNTATSITVTPNFLAVPDTTVTYEVGGITDGWWLGSTGRQIDCVGGATYGANGNWGELGCITYGAPSNGYPNGPTNYGALVQVTLRANVGARGLHPICIVPGSAPACTMPADLPTTAQRTVALTLAGAEIHANTLNGNRRVIECPDPDGNGTVHSADLGLIAAQFGKSPGEAGYTTNRDLDLNGTIGAADLGLVAAVFLKRCVQP